MATPSSILAWRIPWTEEPGKATVHGVAKESRLNSFSDSLPRPFPKHVDTLSIFLIVEIFSTIPQKTEGTKHICARQDYKILIIKRQTAAY